MQLLHIGQSLALDWRLRMYLLTPCLSTAACICRVESCVIRPFLALCPASSPQSSSSGYPPPCSPCGATQDHSAKGNSNLIHLKPFSFVQSQLAFSSSCLFFPCIQLCERKIKICLLPLVYQTVVGLGTKCENGQNCFQLIN